MLDRLVSFNKTHLAVLKGALLDIVVKGLLRMAAICWTCTNGLSKTRVVKGGYFSVSGVEGPSVSAAVR